MRITVDVQTGLAELFADPDVDGAWTLVINGVPQSHVDLRQPELIAFDYVRRMADLIDALAPPGPLALLHLGGGGMTLPRCVAAMRPGSAQKVVELDPDLLSLVLEHLPLPEGEPIEVVVADAAAELAVSGDARYDVVVADIFRGAAIPRHVSTVDFASAAHRVLKPGGCYLVNIMDRPPLDFARRQAAMLRKVFAQVAIVADAVVLRGRRQGNLLLVCGKQHPRFRELRRRMAADPFAVRVEEGERLDRFIRDAPNGSDKGVNLW